MAIASAGAQSKASRKELDPKLLVVGLSLSCLAVYLVSMGRKRRRNAPEISSDNADKRSVQEILAEIDEMDINKIEINPHAKRYLETVEEYLKCFDQLSELYEEVDPSQKLANYDMPDIKRPIQQISISGEPVKNLDELYEVADVIFPVFTTKIESLLEELRNDTSSEEEASCCAVFKLPPWQHRLKRKQRATEKAKDEYSEKGPGPPESWLNDIVRGSVVFHHADQLLLFLELLWADESIEIVKSTNRFRNPTISGYRDWLLQLQISTEDGRIEHTCELQLHLDSIVKSGVRLGLHDYYEFFRLYYGGVYALEDRLDDLRMTCEGGSLNRAFLTNVIENPPELSIMLRLADLFENHMIEYQLALMVTNATKRSLEPKEWYTRMGNLFWQQGKGEDAIGFYEEAMVIQVQALGPDHIDTAESFTNMADALVKQDRLEEAMELYEKALDIALNAYGPEHAEVAAIYSSMANTLANQAKFDDALKMHQKALDIRLKAFGPDHSHTARTYSRMADVLQNQDKLEEALALYQMALVIFFKALGPDHADTSHTYTNMAAVLNKKGRSSGRTDVTNESPRSRQRSSKKLSTKTTSTLKEIMGEVDSPLEENKADKIGETDQQASHPRPHPGHKSRHFGEPNLEVISEDESEDSDLSSVFEPSSTPSLDPVPEQSTPPLNLANMEDMLEEATTLPQKVAEPDDANTATSYVDRAVVQHNQGKLEEAMALYQKALEIRLKVLGPDHAQTADAYFGMANVLKDQDKLEEAMEQFQKALYIRLEVLGPDHTCTADTYSSIGETLCKQGNYEDAFVACRNALEIQLSAIGENHGSTGFTFHTIAEIMFNQGKPAEAMALCQHALAIYWRTLGPGHPSTAKAKELMEIAQNMMTEKCVKRKRREIRGHESL